MFEQIEPGLRECLTEVRVPSPFSIELEQRSNVVSEYFPVNLIVEGRNPKRKTSSFYLDFKYTPLNSEIEICEIHTSPRRKGTGRIVLEGLEQFAIWQNCNRIFLISRDRHSDGFWRRMGYKPNHRTGYYEKFF